jgi:hypothetical protein
MPHGNEGEYYYSVQLLNVIGPALDLAGKGSKQVVLDYIQMRYGMKAELILQYREEFENYLRETLGDSAEIIISKINENLRSAGLLPAAAVPPSSEEGKNKSKKGHGGSSGRRIADIVHFLICDSCFWCASVLREKYESRCQSCGKEIPSAIPVMNNEKFLYEVDERRGITLSFRQSSSS